MCVRLECGYGPPDSEPPGRLQRHGEETPRFGWSDHDNRRPSSRGSIQKEPRGPVQNLLNFAEPHVVLGVAGARGQMLPKLVVEVQFIDPTVVREEPFRVHRCLRTPVYIVYNLDRAGSANGRSRWQASWRNPRWTSW